MTKVLYPQGAADNIALTASGVQTIAIANRMTIIDGVTTQSTSGRTLNVSVSSEIGAGAIILLKTKSTSTETTTMGTGIDGKNYAGVAGKTFTQGFIYDGTTFLPCGEATQID